MNKQVAQTTVIRLGCGKCGKRAWIIG